MFCPNCGKEVVGETNFCSSCGANVSLIKQAIAGLLKPLPPKQSPERKRQKFKGVGFVIIAVGFLYLITMMIVSEIVHKFNWEAGRLLEDLAMFFFLFLTGGILFWLYGIIMYKPEKGTVLVVPTETEPKSKDKPQIVATPKSPSNAEAFLLQPPSVTEHTTAQLKPSQPQPVRLKEMK
ncbi:MAG: zinc ribbon domain-containing protein [Acidobacteriota bacterium]